VIVAVILGFLVDLARLVCVAVLLLDAAGVLVLVHVAVGVRMAVHRSVGVDVLVPVEVLVLVCVHAFLLRSGSF
jgi:hypothetical protein